MIHRLTFVLSLLLVAVALGIPSSSAEGRPICTLSCAEVAATAAGGAIDVTYKRGVSESVPGRGAPDQGELPGRTTWTRTEEQMAPTCSNNSRGNDNTLCGPAISSCPDNLIRFWVWHQVTTFTRQPDGTVTSAITRPWDQEQGSYCLGADDPGVPDIARVVDRIQVDFASLPLRRHAVTTAPTPATLVNIDTVFSAGSAEPQTFTPTLLGTRVTVIATPVRWVWTWGDGTTDAFDRPGDRAKRDVTHDYRRSGDRQVSVLVEWRGTFRIGDDPTEYDIASSAFRRSLPVTVQVRQARSQLVR